MLLGEMLLSDGTLRPDQVEEALAAQVINGGRLGTNLVELGHLTEEQLARALGKQHGVAAAWGEIVPSPQALSMVVPSLMNTFIGSAPGARLATRLVTNCSQ